MPKEAERVSLAPLDPETALRALLKVRPEDKAEDDTPPEDGADDEADR